MQGYKYCQRQKLKRFLKGIEDNGILFNFSTDNVREYEISPTRNGTKQFVTLQTANTVYRR